MHMKLLLLGLFAPLAAFAGGSKIEIKKLDYKCRDGRISTDIDVKINDEKFSLSPSCSFSFSKSLKTKQGTECEVRAGMCSSFSPKNKFEVKCKDGTEQTVAIDCP